MQAARLGGVALVAVSERCPGLSTLNVSSASQLSDAAVAVLMIAHADAPGPADSPGPAATQIELTCAVATLARATQRHAYPAASQFRLYERVLDVDALDAWLRGGMLDGAGHPWVPGCGAGVRPGVAEGLTHSPSLGRCPP